MIAYDNVYKYHHQGKTIHKVLLCFDKEFVNFKTDWQVFDYSDLCSFIQSNYNFKDKSDKTIFIKHYVTFLKEKYIIPFNKIKAKNANIEELLNGYDNFWTLIIYNMIQNAIEKNTERKNYSIVSFSGRQHSPGIRIEIKNRKLKPFDIDFWVWYELQDSKMRIKISGRAYNQKNNFQSKMTNAGFCKAHFVNRNFSSKNSFTLYQEKIEDLSSIENIAKQFIDFKNNIEERLIKNTCN